MRVALAIIWFWVAGSFAWADTRLEDAVEHYLADQDELALPALRVLAQEDNADAQVLLARIRQRPHSPYVKGLSVKERLYLLRSPKGAFGKSWMERASNNGNRLASAFLEAYRLPWSLDKSFALLDVGEQSALALQFQYLPDQADPDHIRELLDNPRVQWDVKPTMIFWLYANGHMNEADVERSKHISGNDPSGFTRLVIVDLLTGADQAFNAENTRIISQFAGLPTTIVARQDGEIAELIEGSPTQPSRLLQSVCASICSEERQQCVGDTIVLAGGFGQLWRLMSPSRSLISEAGYRKSKRAAADVVRHVANLSDRFSDEFKAELTAASCVARVSFGD